jgi:hypothetical protein
MSGVSENPAIIMDRGIFDVRGVRKSRHHDGPRDFPSPLEFENPAIFRDRGIFGVKESENPAIVAGA